MPNLNTPNPGCPTCEDYNCLCQHCELEDRARETERLADSRVGKLNWSKVLKSIDWTMSLETFVKLHEAGDSKSDLKRRFGLLAVALDIPAGLVRASYNSFLPGDSPSV